MLMNDCDSDLDHFEILFPGAAFGTSPVWRNVPPTGAWRDTFVRQALGLVVDPATDQTHPGLERLLFGHLNSLLVIKVKDGRSYLRRPTRLRSGRMGGGVVGAGVADRVGLAHTVRFDCLGTQLDFDHAAC